jgi:hypothetical protein
MSKYEKLKVYVNKKNNQAFVVLPKKKFKEVPDFIFMKKGGFFKKK